MRLEKASAAMTAFLAAGVAGGASDIFLGLWLKWSDAHTLAHFCFGLGFPLFWVGLFSVERKVRWSWQATFDRKFVSRFGDGFWLGAFITAGWSFWNEILVYLICNPTHPADWHHWFADQIGLLVAYQIRNALTRRAVLAAS